MRLAGQVSPAPLSGPVTEARLTYPGRPDQPAWLEVRVRDAGQRTRRALRTLLVSWGLAVVAVFLPVLHFVLVPALVLGGPLLAFQQLRERVTLFGVSGACPACGETLRQPLSVRAQPRIEFRCDGCRRAIGVIVPGHLLNHG